MLFPHVKPPLGVPIYEHDPSLEAFWLMNEGTGNTVCDLSGNGNTGTFVGHTHFVPGEFGPCLSFDGTDDYVNVADSDSLDTTVNMTLSVWVNSKVWTVSGYNEIIAKSGLFLLRSLHDGVGGGGERPGLIWFNGAEVWHIKGGVVPLNSWHHIVAVVENNVPTKIYNDGIDSGATPTYWFDDTRVLTNSLRIGISLDGTNDFAGQIDNVKIYSRALSASEVTDLCARPFAMFERPSIAIILAGVSAGGAALEVNVSDALGVADAVSAQVPVLEASVADAIGVADGTTAQVPVLEASVADSIGVIDGATAQRVDAVVLEVSVSDDIGVADEAAAQVPVLVASVADTIGVADEAAAQVPVLAASVVDAIGVADEAAAQVPVLEASVSEAIGVADEATALLIEAGVLQVSVSDDIGVADAAAAQVPVLEVGVADSIGVADAVAAQVPVLAASVSDTIGVADATSASVPVLGISVFDNIGVADYASAVTAVLHVSVADYIGVTDAASAQIPVLAVSVSDSIGVSDSVTALVPDMLLEVAVSDSIGVSDAASSAIAIYPLLQAFLSVRATRSILSIRDTGSMFDIRK